MCFYLFSWRPRVMADSAGYWNVTTTAYQIKLSPRYEDRTRQVLERTWGPGPTRPPGHPVTLSLCYREYLQFEPLQGGGGRGGGPQQPWKCAHCEGIMGDPHPRKRRPWRRPEPEAPPCRGGLGRDPAQSSCTSRGCVEEALLPTELTRTEWSTAGCAGLGLLLDTLE